MLRNKLFNVCVYTACYSSDIMADAFVNSPGCLCICLKWLVCGRPNRDQLMLTYDYINYNLLVRSGLGGEPGLV